MRQRVTFDRAKPRKKNSMPQSLELMIDDLSHDGRGVGRHNGKTVFVADALPGDKVVAKITKQQRRFDEAVLSELLESSTQRVQPTCKHYKTCGGCQLQHLNTSNQVQYKQNWVLQQLERAAKLLPDHIGEPLTSSPYNYRRSARIGINQTKSGDAVVGFRRKNSNRIENVDHCPVLNSTVEHLFPTLRTLLNKYRDEAKQITHAELSIGDNNGLLCFRIKKNLSQQLQQGLCDLCQPLKLNLYFQTDETLETIWQNEPNSFSIYQDIELRFMPGDFIQVNSSVNELMIKQAIDWLSPAENDRILDLFCGLGNFSLPLARKASEVIGVEGSDMMVQRATDNAELNNIHNCTFMAADLSKPIKKQQWFNANCNLALIDPPRTGAFELVKQLEDAPFERILYISCNPASLVRDAAVLCNHGYKLTQFGVMDMFPQTTHIESMALFERA